MLARLHSMALVGIDAVSVTVEVAVADRRFRAPVIVGLPDAAVKESVERIQSAFEHTGLKFPSRAATINLAPADLRKEGPAFDLPIAVGLLMASKQLPLGDHLDGTVIAGELGLNGELRPVRGALSMALAARAAGKTGMILPAGSATEAAVVTELDVRRASTIIELIDHLNGTIELPRETVDVDAVLAEGDTSELDYADVRGQEHVKRALIIAAAGGHNLLLIGPPGSGKSMLCKRLPSILPPLSLEESLETSRVYSARGLLDGAPLVAARPVRSPHHTASTPALVGGGMGVPRPGEVSLAHHGVLFLDEFPEFSRPTLEAMRQPMEDEVVSIARSQQTVKFPARFMLVAAMNPSPGGHEAKGSGPSGRQQAAYMARISGPIVDRIDLHVEVPAVPPEMLRSQKPGTSSAAMRDKVMAARAIQRTRYGPGTMVNARLSSKQVRDACPLDGPAETILQQALRELGLSARAHDKILRISRTLADLAGREAINAADVSEAILYRKLDRG